MNKLTAINETQQKSCKRSLDRNAVVVSEESAERDIFFYFSPIDLGGALMLLYKGPSAPTL